MNFLQLFGFRRPVVEPVDDVILGRLQWNERQWEGSYNGCRFDIAGPRNGPVPRALIEYTAALLGDRDYLLATLDAEKQKLIKEFSGAEAEIGALVFDSFSILQHKRECRAIGWLSPEGLRFWHIEYHGNKCMGLTFDS